MPHKPETIYDHVWAGLYNAGAFIGGEDKGRYAMSLIEKRVKTGGLTLNGAVKLLEAAEKAQHPPSYLLKIARAPKAQASVRHPRPDWCVSEDALNYYGRMDKHGNKQTMEKAVRV
ncbi:hypothetical protein LCGC14_3039820 [marine sediment metagenome]|uniref:Uncharacterized protein n=1 Tax=marine sediment metagenome TaxID=412755 RepID=A0A0F8ZFY2_9ZZZZ